MTSPSKPARRYADVVLAAFVLAMVAMMIVPLPTPLLDVLLASNISIGVLLLLVALYVKNGLAFASFPTVLLVTTLYRLALNVSSTRLILLQADAGEVIHAFGSFVVRGNYIVGAVMFLILTLIQFIVVAKGSERVAEVGARFTLDAMPGKQMSIDAELRSGALTQEEAQKRRRTVQRESEFFGAMDGAMKFVKGDAIASVVITVINVLGGLAIGVGTRHMSVIASLKTYGLLTIGDGLVSQIPALLISTAAGLVVTRVSSEKDDQTLGGDIAAQIFGESRPLLIAAAFLGLLALVPGLPTVPFLVLGVGLFFLSRRVEKSASVTADAEAAGASPVRADGAAAGKPMVPLIVPIAVDLGPEVYARIVGDNRDGDLVVRALPELRDSMFLTLGLSLPSIRTRRAPQLPANAYSIAIQEVPLASGEVREGMVFVAHRAQSMAPLGIAAEDAKDPVTGVMGAWVRADAADALTARNVATAGDANLITRHLARALRLRAADFVGLQEAQGMLDQLERAYPALVRNVVPKPVSLTLLTDVLRRLVEEGVNVRPLREILETLAVFAPNEKDPVALTELVRAALKRQITHRLASSGVLPVFLLAPEIEEAVRDAIQRTATGSYLAMAPDLARDVIAAVTRDCGGPGSLERPPIILTQGDVRRFVRRLLEVELPDLVVLGYQELAPEITVQPMGRIAV